MNGYERLCNAVVMQAVRNWRYATRKLKRNPGNYEAKRLKKDCEQFFLSQYFNMYTDLDGRALLDKLRKMLNRPPPIIYIRKDKRMMHIIKILIWSFWLFCCNCLVAFLFVVIGSLIFYYHIHFYAGLIGGAVLSLCELIYVIVLIRHSKTPMTEKEIAYCENDVLVASAYIQEEIEKKAQGAER